MPKTANVFSRVEPQIKEEAEQILDQLGLSMSSAVELFLRQVILTKGIPFAVKLPGGQLPDYNQLSEKQFNLEIQRGLNDIQMGDTISESELTKALNKKYGIRL
ncbi:MAG: type II toxin-antitoxin system RelB/DinJ family antitoxin [Firmicutes bacterium]|nr:type II toxin-antitoxin system RelB/DinJ family antitoxin [Bacillota bacterium]MCR4712365.1 type II toxin-antitoxin system RelB/DinJ family antitoxin [Clostridia bacterium]